jgi:hypothetical protein
MHPYSKTSFKVDPVRIMLPQVLFFAPSIESLALSISFYLRAEYTCKIKRGRKMQNFKLYHFDARSYPTGCLRTRILLYFSDDL